MIVEKAYNMAKKMNIPVLGLVENYSYLECPDCGKKISVFGESHIDEIAENLGRSTRKDADRSETCRDCRTGEVL